MGWCERTLSIGFIWIIGQWSRVDTGFDLMQCGLQLSASEGMSFQGLLQWRLDWTDQSFPPTSPPWGAWGICLQSGATWPNCFCNCWGLATNPFALSEKITRGSPRRAAKRRNANNVCLVDSDSTNSRCTARITPQEKSNTQNFLRGKSQQHRGPAWSKPVIANGKDWVTRRSGKGLIGCWQGDESWRLKCTHSLLTRFAKRRTPKIKNWFLSGRESSRTRQHASSENVGT